MLDRQSVLHLLMLASAVCPALAWQQGVAWIADVGDPMIHFFCQMLAVWFTLRRKWAGPLVYLLLVPFAALDLAFAFTTGMNVPATQIAYVPLVAATAAWAFLAIPHSSFDDE